MCDNNLLLVEHSTGINKIIHNTFQGSQRIRITAFDVSAKYLVFGVNSGGLYIFRRDPCQFLKLIPSTYGPVNLISICNNQENLAISVSSGLIVILENCFSDIIFQQNTYGEHVNNTITAFKWNGAYLYCGDSSGKISAITLKSFLSKAIFQSSLAVLMHLDSHIVQIDALGKFLLISTLTRTVLCDTELERYRQIGRKSRDGHFGACFSDTEIIEHWQMTDRRGFFKTASDNEPWSLSQVDTNRSIYCARPGARLWQADFTANVNLTHQFRSAMKSAKPNDLIRINVENNLEILKNQTEIESFSFGKLFMFQSRHVLTYNDVGFYVFDLSKSELLYSHSIPVKDLKIVNGSIYIWNANLVVTVISLLTVEELILDTLFKREYRLCAEICLAFQEEVESLIETSGKIHLISILEQKLLSQSEVMVKLSNIFAMLREKSNKTVSLELERFKNEIVIVNNPEIIEYPEENFLIDNVEANSKQKELDILKEQYVISTIQNLVETSDFTDLIKSKSTDELYDLFREYMTIETSASDWCKEKLLEHITSLPENEEALTFIGEAFLEVNRVKNRNCKCNFPLPRAHETIPKNYRIGLELMEKSMDLDNYLTNVPYMYKYIVDNLREIKDIRENCSLLIQFSDVESLGKVALKFTYDLWDEALPLFIKLNEGLCLNCSTEIDITGIVTWNTFAKLMVRSVNASNALKLLKRYSSAIPNQELDQSFYQYCINSAISSNDDQQSPEQLERKVGEYLQKKYNRGMDLLASSFALVKCDQCHLPITDNKTCKLPCGHAYHRVCSFHLNQCSICSL